MTTTQYASTAAGKLRHSKSHRERVKERKQSRLESLVQSGLRDMQIEATKDLLDSYFGSLKYLSLLRKKSL